MYRLFIKRLVGVDLMDIKDEELIKKITSGRSEVSWSVKIQGEQYTPKSVEIAKSMIPVKKPDMRGGVYFSETEAYKVKCTIVGDLAVTGGGGVLTGSMLGPNTDFTPIEIIAVLPDEPTVRVVANLTNYVQVRGGNGVELSLVVVDVIASP